MNISSGACCEHLKERMKSTCRPKALETKFLEHKSIQACQQPYRWCDGNPKLWYGRYMTDGSMTEFSRSSLKTPVADMSSPMSERPITYSRVYITWKTESKRKTQKRSFSGNGASEPEFPTPPCAVAESSAIVDSGSLSGIYKKYQRRLFLVHLAYFADWN